MEEYKLQLGYKIIELSILDNQIETYICNSNGDPVIFTYEEMEIFITSYNNFKKQNNK